MKSELEQIWLAQKEQQQRWHDWAALSEIDRELLVKELLLGLHEEVAEMQRRLDQTKFHVLKRSSPSSRDDVAVAGIDVFKYLVALMLLHGVGPDDFFSQFAKTTRVVEAKWKWERDNLAGIDVLMSDMDGCIADWTGGFLSWATEHGANIKPGELNRPELEGLKDEFYASGGFLHLKPIDNAIPTLKDWLGPATRRLILVTARPYRRHRRVYADTLEWCEKHGLAFDHILFESDKAEAVRQVQPANIVAFIEDRGKHCLEIAHTGVKVLKLPGDLEKVQHPNIHECLGWGDIERFLGVPVRMAQRPIQASTR